MYRFALWHPDLVTHVFSVCTPYTAPSAHYIALEDVVKQLPQFGYQIHLASGDVEQHIQTPEQIRQFLHGMYGGKTADGKRCFDPRTGVIFDALPGMQRSPLYTDEMMDYYVQEFSRHGLHGTLNWYRTREVRTEVFRNLNDNILSANPG